MTKIRPIALLLLPPITFLAGVFFEHYKIFPYRPLANYFSDVKYHRGIGTQTILNTSRAQFLRKDVLAEGFEGLGGAIVEIDGIILGSDKIGKFFCFSEGFITPILLEIPNLRSGLDSFLDSPEFDDIRPRAISMFRVLDMIVRAGDHRELLVSHHFFDAANQTKSMRISKLSLDSRMNLESFKTLTSNWELLWESEPLSMFGHRVLYSEHHGGRMVILPDSDILLSVGEYHMDGVHNLRIAASESNSYGKFIRIDPRTGNSSTFATGTRNPQGLLVDKKGRIWSTEHGPEGGDELNLVQEGSHFGWPFATFGTEYESQSWPLDQSEGHHRHFQRPVFSWVPSIAISQLVMIDTVPEAWKGDLLVASLGPGNLYRIRLLENDQVAYIEDIPINLRLRDILQADDGSIFLWTDESVLVQLTHITTAAESMLDPRFAAITEIVDTCQTCHSTSKNSRSRQASSLWNVYGRDIASPDLDYDFSDALREKGGIWKRENLKRYITQPREFAPGTKMVNVGLQDGEALELLILYLESLK